VDCVSWYDESFGNRNNRVGAICCFHVVKAKKNFKFRGARDDTGWSSNDICVCWECACERRETILWQPVDPRIVGFLDGIIRYRSIQF
jgi:hypothetical protein